LSGEERGKKESYEGKEKGGKDKKMKMEEKQ